MKVFTSIPPRRDGSVIVEVVGGSYTFRADEQYGVLSCDMPVDAVQQLPDNGNFFTDVPEIREADNDKPQEFVVDEDAEDGDDDSDANAPLIEESAFSASTPPLATAARPRGRPRK